MEPASTMQAPGVQGGSNKEQPLPMTKLLQNIEMSYRPCAKILEESEKMAHPEFFTGSHHGKGGGYLQMQILNTKKGIV